MSGSRFPTLFISHGGGPWPWVDDMRPLFALSEASLRQLPQTLPGRPLAVLVISGHWEAPRFSVATAEHPPTLYDYYGFPAHTYQIQYPAPGSPQLARRVSALLGQAGIACDSDALRGFDHGAFVPLALMYPQADIPVLMLSLRSSYDPLEHLRLGAALQPLRDEGVLILGSGLSYHNMRGFGRPESLAVSMQFEDYLHRAVCATPQLRNEMLANWSAAPAARAAHPREDHLLPLMVAAGTAGDDIGRRLLLDRALEVVMASYRFG